MPEQTDDQPPCHGNKTSVARGLEQVCRFKEGHAERGEAPACELVDASPERRLQLALEQENVDWIRIALTDAPNDRWANVRATLAEIQATAGPDTLVENPMRSFMSDVGALVAECNALVEAYRLAEEGLAAALTDRPPTLEAVLIHLEAGGKVAEWDRYNQDFRPIHRLDEEALEAGLALALALGADPLTRQADLRIVPQEEGQ